MSDELKQHIITNIPASPLSSDSPDFLTASLISLAKSYLQNKDVAFLGHAIKLMRPFAGSICRSNGIETYNEMIATDPEIRKAISVPFLASTSNEVLFGAPKTFPTVKEQETAEIAANFLSEMTDQMTLPFEPERKKIVYDSLRYGNGIGEIEYGKGYGRLKDRLVVKQVRSVDIKDLVIVTDSFNRIIGYAPYGFPGVTAPLDSWVPADGFISYLFDAYERQADREDVIVSAKLLPKYKCLHLQWEARSDEPRGAALLDAAFQAWWAKQQVIPILLYFLENWAIPRKEAKLSEKAEDVRLYDANNQPIIDGTTGLQATQPPLPVLYKRLEEWGAGGGLALPFGYETDIHEANPLMVEAILKAIDFFNREISSAITMQFLSASQGQKSGGEKGVQSHRDVLSLMILKIKRDQAVGIREQICKPIMAANFGLASKRYAPKVDLGDADGFPISLNELGFLAQSIPDFFTPEMFPEVGRKVGFPYIQSKRKMTLKKSQIKDAQALFSLLQTQLGCGQGSFSLEFED